LLSASFVFDNGGCMSLDLDLIFTVYWLC